MTFFYQKFSKIGILFIFIISLIFTNCICLYLLYMLHCQFQQQNFFIENLQTKLELLTVSLEDMNMKEQLLEAELRKTTTQSTQNVGRWFDFSYFNVSKRTSN